MLRRRSERYVRAQGGAGVVMDLVRRPDGSGPGDNTRGSRARDGAEGAAFQRERLVLMTPLAVFLLGMLVLGGPGIRPGHTRGHGRLPRQERRSQQDRETRPQYRRQGTTHGR